jgi:hypothetical protein
MKILKYILILSTILSLSGCGSVSECELNNGVVCYDKKDELYLLEENASLLVAVPTSAFGQALVELWDTNFPSLTGVIQYEVVNQRLAQYYLNNPRYDLIYISQYELPLIMNMVQVVDEDNVESFSSYMVEGFAELINSNGYIFTPIAYEGFLFAYDETLLNEANISLDDSNSDGLPDSIDSWEKIFRRITVQKDQLIDLNLKNFFPLALNEKYSFYPMLTAGGWQMFDDLKADKPGFNSLTFKSSLRFIYEMGKYDWNLNQEKTSKDYVFSYEEVLEEQSSPLTMISSWMFYNEYEEINKANYRFSHMPSYDGHVLSPLLDIEGYAISAKTPYPNIANQLLKLIRSKQGLQQLIDNTDLPLMIKIDDKLDIEIHDQNKYDMIKAYAYSVEEPLIALSANTSIRAWQMYYDIDWLSVVKSLYDHDITVSEAQAQIIEMANQWLIDKGEIN